MPARIGNVTFDCDDALLVASFWSAVLGRPLDPGGDAGFASIGAGDAERAEAAWFFEKVSEPKAAKNRMHLDLVDPDDDRVDRLVALGASVIAEHEFQGHRWTVLQDPEGNEFCIAREGFVVPAR